MRLAAVRAVARLSRHRARVRPLRRARQRERSAGRIAHVLSTPARRRLSRHGRGQGRPRQGLADLGSRRQAPPGELGLLGPGRLLRQDRRHAGLLRRALVARRAAARRRGREAPAGRRAVPLASRRARSAARRGVRRRHAGAGQGTKARARLRRHAAEPASRSALPRQLDRPPRPRDDRSGAARSAVVPDRQLRRTALPHRRDAADGRALSRARSRRSTPSRSRTPTAGRSRPRCTRRSARATRR